MSLRAVVIYQRRRWLGGGDERLSLSGGRRRKNCQAGMGSRVILQRPLWSDRQRTPLGRMQWGVRPLAPSLSTASNGG